MVDLRSERLQRQRLLGPPFASAAEAVARLGGVQAQDLAGAKWALSQRAGDTVEAELDALVDSGELLRTHVLRPTWHLVTRADVRWLLELTAPRIRRAVAGRHRVLELDEPVARRAAEVFAAALEGGRHLTRLELGEELGRAGIQVNGPRLAHLILCAELDRVVVSGPRRGRQITYALMSERARGARSLDRDEALGELARRYFSTRGPARLDDYAWWSGLTHADARRGVELAGDVLERVALDGVTFWRGGPAPARLGAAPAVHLLPNWDEYTVAYRHRSAVEPEVAFDAGFFPFGSILANVVTVDGRVRGGWKRVDTRAGANLEIRLLRPLNREERAGLEAVAQRYASFLGRPVELRAA